MAALVGSLLFCYARQQGRLGEDNHGNWCIYIYIYTYTHICYVCMYVCIYIYIYIEREREIDVRHSIAML